jgi:Zn-dependent protease with chaperone function
VIRAQLYDGRTSGSRAAQVAIEGAGTLARLRIRAAERDSSVPLVAVQIGERVGETNRLLQLPDGASLEVIDNVQFDSALEAAEVRTREAPLRRLESRWAYALAAVAATVLCAGFFVRYGIPALAARAVRYIPADVDSYIGADSVRVLDRSVFRPSALPPERQAQLRRLFAEVAADADDGAAQRYRLELRAGGSLGANAFALPSGIVVLTDQLAQLARNDDELRGVFAHEVGHLVNRHAMRMLVQDSASALLVIGVFGDVSGVSSLAAVAPTVLVNAAYSRNFEREADAFAFRWMRRHAVPPERLGDLLERLASEQGAQSGGYLASHPDLRERVNALHGPGDATHPSGPAQ